MKKVEITDVWSPERGTKLVWEHGMLRSVISAGYPGGHRLLDCFVRAADSYSYKELEDYVSKGQSLFFEYIGMHVEKGSDIIILVDNDSKESAQIKKETFLKLIKDLEQSFSKSNFALPMKDSIRDGENSQEVNNFLEVRTF